jgi:hypothetical protein
MVEKRIKPLPEDYVVELLSEHGDCDRIVGWGPDVDAAHQCYDDTVKKYPHDTVRLRQGTQSIVLSMRGSFVPPRCKH